MKYAVIVLLACAGCTPTLPTNFISAAEYDRSIKEYRDQVTGNSIYSVQLGAKSEEENAWWPRYTCKIEVLKGVSDDPAQYHLRFVLSSGPEEWPIAPDAHLVIGIESYPLELQFLRDTYTAQFSGSGMENDYSVNTVDRQLHRIESTVTESVLNDFARSKEAWIVFRSGSIPVSFRLDDQNNARLRTFLNLRPVNS